MSSKPASAGPVGRFAADACRVLLVLPLVGCGSELDACPGVALDTRFELEVLAPSEPEASCLDAWGLGSGTVVAGRIAELSGENDCRSGVPEIASVGDWSWKRESGARILGGYTLEGSYVVSRAECSARLWLIFSSEPAFGCDASRGDRCELEARITPTTANETLCPALCSGSVGVRAERL